MTDKKRSKTATTAAPDPRTLQLVQEQDETTAQTLGRVAPDPALNAGSVMQPFSSHLGQDVSLMSMIAAVNGITDRVKAGDLSDLEGMLVSQATALQTIFTNLARRAQAQTYQRNFEAFLGLALKAQTQSRSTISALVDLKYPRTTVIAKQANVANGPQQVNNGVAPDADRSARTHGDAIETPPIKKLELSNGKWLDAGAQGAAIGTDPYLEAVGKDDRPQEPRRKS